MYRTDDLPAFEVPAVPVTAPAATGSRETAGYGACSESGCICQAYSGEGPLCQNCAHSYEQHW